MPKGGSVWYGELKAVVLVVTVGDAGVGGGGLGAEIGMVGTASASGAAASSSSSQDSATGMGFVRIFGGCASGEMASLSREECKADTDAEVEVIFVEDYSSEGIVMQWEMDGMGSWTWTGRFL